MLTVLPHPDELSTGHLGRLSRLNGFEDSISCLRAMRLEYAASGVRVRRTPAIHVLAAAAVMDTGTYERLHSLLPFMFFAVREQVRTSSTNWSLAIVGKNGLSTPRKHVYFCPACVHEDLSFWGYSYWRRTHQLPSAFWCSKHPEEKLRAVFADHPFNELPQHWLENGQSRPHSLPHNIRSHTTLLRLEEACQLMLEAGTSRNVKVVRRALITQAEAFGLTTKYRAVRRGSRLSDLTKEKMPRCLREALFSALPAKVFGNCVNEIDAAVWMAHNGSMPTATALAISLLFPAVSEVFQKMDEAEASLPKASFVKTIAQQYLQTDGDMAAIARRLCVSISKVDDVIRSSGIEI